MLPYIFILISFTCFLMFRSGYDSRYYGSQGRTVGIVEPQPASSATAKSEAVPQDHEPLSSQHQVLFDN